MEKLVIRKRRTPRKAIRRYCARCCCGQKEVKHCAAKICKLHPIRSGFKRDYPHNPVPLIKAKCRECAGSGKAANRCEEEECELWPFRKGVNPNLSERNKKGARTRQKMYFSQFILRRKRQKSTERRLSHV